MKIISSLANVFFFNQKGLMGPLGLQGTKITQYTPSK